MAKKSYTYNSAITTKRLISACAIALLLGIFLIIYHVMMIQTVLQRHQAIHVFKQQMELNMNRSKMEPPAAISIKVISGDNPQSLEQLLDSIENSYTTRKNIGVQIYIDGKKDNAEQCKEVADNWKWMHGTKHVYRWISARESLAEWSSIWIPYRSDTAALILREKTIVSPMAMQWLEGIHKHYSTATHEIAGAVLPGAMKEAETALPKTEQPVFLWQGLPKMTSGILIFGDAWLGFLNHQREKIHSKKYRREETELSFNEPGVRLGYRLKEFLVENKLYMVHMATKNGKPCLIAHEKSENSLTEEWESALGRFPEVEHLRRMDIDVKNKRSNKTKV